jgi:hypothetical protein
MVYYSRYVTGIKKVVNGVSLLQLVLTWPLWAYHVVKPYQAQVLPSSSLAHLLWLKTTGVSLTLTKCTPWVLVIIDPCPCDFVSDFECLSFICFAESWMSKLTPPWSLFLLSTLTQFGWSLNDSPNPLTSYPSTPSIELRSMMRSILLMCYVCTEFWRWSFLIEGRNLSLTFGSNCTRPSGLTLFIVRPIIYRWITKLRE